MTDTSAKRTLGTCYYPEHWPQKMWQDDAKRMVEAGLTWVRIGEFAWSLLEPTPGCYDFDWLDKAIACLGAAGLQVVLGTPTATPPRWMIDKYPDMLAVDRDGKPRKFGSRRHYCFSHEGYKAECARIVTELAKRYGQNPHVAAWQTDNEYGCHDTTLSYSPAAKSGFQEWCRTKYSGADNNGDIAALNKAWGNVFWSMSYAAFEDIDLPNLTVTEANPAHSLAFRQFTSEQVVAFNRLQVEIIRAHSTAPIAHNYMGRITDFDHFAVGNDLDIASWDSYPLGFLADRAGASEAHQKDYMRQGDPDFQAFHHDLYRSVGKGRLWIMEQQPGPVNWAPYNPDPLPGMVRLWTWEAFAHGAEAVLYFRWRQFPAAQEQLHAGLMRPDNLESTGYHEAKQVSEELKSADIAINTQSEVALIFDYDADAAWDIQPHNTDTSYFAVVMDHYRALRKLGLNIDIVSTDVALDGYKLVIAPSLIFMSETLKQRLSGLEAQIVIGPRSASRVETMQIPNPLPPALPNLDVTVIRLDSYRQDMPVRLSEAGHAVCYCEVLETKERPLLTKETGEALAITNGHISYVGAILDEAALRYLYTEICGTADIETFDMPDGVRRRQTATEEFWFNYASEARQIPDGTIEPAGVLRKVK